MKFRPAKDIIGVFGTRGGGKTVWIRDYIQTLPRVIVLENGNEEYTDICPLKAYSIEQLAESLLDRGKFKILYTNVDSDDITALDEMCEIARAYTADINNRFNVSLPITLVIDEAQNYTSPWKTSKMFRKAIMQSRHFDFNIVYSTQRPSQISRNLTSQSSRFIIYNLVEHTDVKFFYSFIGADASLIPDLRKYHYLDCDLSSKNITEKMINL